MLVYGGGALQDEVSWEGSTHIWAILRALGTAGGGPIWPVPQAPLGCSAGDRPATTPQGRGWPHAPCMGSQQRPWAS
jgi:hypothetical protein